MVFLYYILGFDYFVCILQIGVNKLANLAGVTLGPKGKIMLLLRASTKVLAKVLWW